MPLRGLIIALVLLTAAAVQSVDSRRAAADVAPRPATDSAAGRAAMRVAVDPLSGDIIGQPTADDLGRLGAPGRGARRSADELAGFDLPNGARGVALDDWADHALRVERDADGALRVVCSRGDDHGGGR